MSSLTYFILAGGHVKIGRSRNPQSRLAQISTSSPTAPVLLNVSTIGEREAHAKAATLTKRKNGEWFEDSEELRRWIDGLERSSVTRIEKTRRFEAAASPSKPASRSTERPPVQIARIIFVDGRGFNEAQLKALRTEAKHRGLSMNQLFAELVDEVSRRVISPSGQTPTTEARP